MADKEEIRDRSDIVEVIGNVVSLKKKGRGYLGLCPFHQEKTPSFNVDSVFRSFKCFGCGASGDVFTFVEKYENMTFVEAAEFLARRVGLSFDRIGSEGEGTRASERDQLYNVNAEAMSWFRTALERDPKAREYVYGRGLVHDTIKRFQLGYAPQGWDNLVRHLGSRRIDLKIAANAGLLQNKDDSDHYYDAFRHRIMFPILDEQERVVGFGGRAFGDDQPKYLNTGETPIFNKSRLLYGLSHARRKISAENRVLLMEGYMDVIAAHQAGFTNAVATLGTSLTKEHAKKLAQLAPVVALVYDADNAGIKATLRAAEVFKEVLEDGVREVELRMVRLQDGDDPDSVLKRGDISVFQRAIDNAGQYVDYLIDAAKRRQDMNTETGKAKFLSDLSRILVDMPQMEACDVYLTEYAHLHPYSRYSLQSAVEQMRRELLERKQRVHHTRRKPRSVSPQPPTSAPSESRGVETPRETTAAVEPIVAPVADTVGMTKPPVAAPPILAKNQGDRQYRPPLSREERMERDKKLYRQSIRPVERAATVMTAEERAENELLRAMLEPEWRPYVLRHINPEELLSPMAARLATLVMAHEAALDWEADTVIKLVESQHDDSFSAAVRDRAQEFRAHMENVPITEALIVKCAQTLHRMRRKKHVDEVAAELDGLLRTGAATEMDRARVRELSVEHQKLLKELKGSA